MCLRGLSCCCLPCLVLTRLAPLWPASYFRVSSHSHLVSCCLLSPPSSVSSGLDSYPSHLTPHHVFTVSSHLGLPFISPCLAFCPSAGGGRNEEIERSGGDPALSGWAGEKEGRRAVGRERGGFRHDRRRVARGELSVLQLDAMMAWLCLSHGCVCVFVCVCFSCFGRPVSFFFVYFCFMGCALPDGFVCLLLCRRGEGGYNRYHAWP